ncbi:hypothetical protein FIA58_007045 [Flavobacterium jejuense]|uniref:DUF4397 domain-containing protein n=1 Tax=Flavobacterium jejuense TaxID=1544455 RepID=A0ABX0IPE2_9FLAO|nr:hypothetical protein [Flavobacterium jejuense]NHN25428.1 hypothetical protein [Flavobacterium jejuense]
MNKLLVFTLSILLFSCSKDDNDDSNQASTRLAVNGKSYDISKATAVDNYRFSSDSHAEFDFLMTNGTLNILAEPMSYFGFEATNASILLNVQMFSNNTSFSNGVYTFVQNGNILDPQPASNFFSQLGIQIDGNNDNDFNDIEDIYLTATAGTVSVLGSSPNYTLAIDVTLSNNENFTYTYNGGFDYYNNRGN